MRDGSGYPTAVVVRFLAWLTARSNSVQPDPMKREQLWRGAHPKKKQRGVGSFLIQNNHYAYDLVGNILKVENQLPIIRNALGGASSYEYQYDNLNRLTLAKGNYTGELTSASYELKMSYNNLNSITKKELNHLSGGVQKGYTLDYSYNNPSHPHAPSEIMEMGKPKARTYQYDGNGNPLYYEESKSFRSMVWDEENRLRGINDNGKLHLYTYDHTGERALKSSGESSTVVTNGLTSAVITHMDDYTAYVNPYFVVQKGRFTKHYFEGSSRIVSKLGEGTFHHNNRGISAGGIDYIRQSAQMQEARDRYIKGSLTPPGPPTQHGIYASPEWTGQPYPSLGWQNIRQDQEPPEGWPRPPKFNEPGDVPGPPVQYGDPITPQTVKAGYGFIDNGIIEKNLYFYHPDHLGSSSYITDREGRITQHTEYIAFGEVLFEEHSTSRTMPYLFNGKELDTETGLYYYGARYYDPRVSLWLNVDPMMLRDEAMDDEDSSNGGVFNPMNNAVYAFSYQNPVKYVDPDGECPNCITAAGGALVGGFIGGVVEAGMQLYKDGKITSWKAIGGSVAQGAITGGVAGFTGGASLAVTAGVAGGANVVGGVANRAIQGKETTATDVVVDATVGAVLGAAGKHIGGNRNLYVVSSKTGKSVTKSFFSNTRYTNKVLGQMKKGDAHSFPESVKSFESNGTISTIIGGDGVSRQMLKIPGKYKGKQGNFEFIKEPNGNINHRLFRPNK